jgi:hypothetical protein
MTQANDICLPTPLSIQVFGRPEEWEWIEPTDENNEPEPTTAPALKLEEDRLSA